MGLFKKKSQRDVLQKKYEQLMKEWHRLSAVNRAASDEKYAEAQKIMDQLDDLKENA